MMTPEYDPNGTLRNSIYNVQENNLDDIKETNIH